MAKSGSTGPYMWYSSCFQLRIGNDDEFEMWLNAVEDPNIKDEFERTPLLLGDLQASPHPYMDYMGLPPVVICRLLGCL